MAMRCALETRCDACGDSFYFFDNDRAVDAAYCLKMKELCDKYKDKNIMQIDDDEDRNMILASLNFPSYAEEVYFEQVWFYYIEKQTLTIADLQRIAKEEHNKKLEQELDKLD